MKVVDIREILEGKERIELPDRGIYDKVRLRWDNAAKPLDSLGKFEDVTAKIGAVHGSEDIDIGKRTVIVMCADNGVVEEGISQSGQEVTLAVSKAMGRRESSVCKMAKRAGTDVMPIDIGINSDEEIPGVILKKVRKGTRNFAKEPAMTEEEVLDALQVGIDAAFDAVQRGNRLLCTGEMGIGNTTTSAALAAAFLKCPAGEVVGRGSGLNDEKLAKKEKTIDASIENYKLFDGNPVKILGSVGGLDIAGMAGVMIGGAYYHVPVVLDGVVSCAAAFAAVRLVPEVREYLIASHISREPAAKHIFEELKLEPVIDADMALGEGTGAVMMCALLDIALSLYSKQLTFEDIEIEKYVRF